MNKRPLIGVTGPAKGHWPSMFFIWLGLKRAGADMVRLRPGISRKDHGLDGLIVSGGTDVDRCGTARSANRTIHTITRVTSWKAIGFWLHKPEKLPIMGICRGAQLLNVVRGGSLYMDIRLVCETAKYPGNFISKIFYRKTVLLKDGSRIEEVLGARKARVNSLHRQSLDRIGEGLTVTAWEENTIVQAVEGARDHPFVLGVQWHPEFMPFFSPATKDI